MSFFLFFAGMASKFLGRIEFARTICIQVGVKCDFPPWGKQEVSAILRVLKHLETIESKHLLGSTQREYNYQLAKS